LSMKWRSGGNQHGHSGPQKQSHGKSPRLKGVNSDYKSGLPFSKWVERTIHLSMYLAAEPGPHLTSIN
jgi:hypothetical protein